jgi:hypothetical protein
VQRTVNASRKVDTKQREELQVEVDIPHGHEVFVVLRPAAHPDADGAARVV